MPSIEIFLRVKAGIALGQGEILMFRSANAGIRKSHKLVLKNTFRLFLRGC